MSENPFERTIPFTVNISMPGKVKKVKTVQRNQRVKANKTLYDCEEYDAICSLASEVRSFMKKKEVGGGKKIFKDGTYPIPIPMVTEIDDYLQQKCKEFNVLVDKFVEVYDTRMEEGLMRLQKEELVLNGEQVALAVRSDYSSGYKIGRKFSISYEMTSFGPPQSLEGVSKELFMRETNRIKELGIQAIDEVRLALRSLFQELLDHMVEQLQPAQDGKKKVIRTAMVSNMLEFIREFKNKNITDDTDLESLVGMCEKVLKGKDVETLRKRPRVRDAVMSSLDSIKNQLKEVIASGPSRDILLDD